MERIAAQCEFGISNDNREAGAQYSRRLRYIKQLVDSADKRDDYNVFQTAIISLSKIQKGIAFRTGEDIETFHGILPAVLRILYELGETEMN